MPGRRTYDRFDEEWSPDFEDALRDGGRARRSDENWKHTLREMSWDDDDNFDEDDYSFDEEEDEEDEDEDV